MMNEAVNQARRGLHHRKALHARFSPTFDWSSVPEPTRPAGPPDQPPPQQPQPPRPPQPQPQPQQSTTATSSPPSSTSNSTSTSSSSTSSTTGRDDQSTASTTSSTTVTQGNQNTQVTRVQQNNPAPTAPPITKVVTSSASVRGNLSGTSIASSPSTSTTPAPGSSISTPVIVGGVVAAVIAVLGVIFAVVYFLRRSRRDDEPIEGFQHGRQSVLLPEPDARPPAPSQRSMPMTQNTNGFPAMASFGGQNFRQGPAGYPEIPVMPHPYNNVPQPGYGPQPPFGNVEYYATPHAQPHPGAHPTINTSFAATPNPFQSPISESSHGAGTPRTNSPEGQPGIVPAGPAGNPYVTRQARSSNGTDLVPPEADYVDLNRSSVSPFQAAQYAEISRRLNVPPPVPTLDGTPEPIAKDTPPQFNQPLVVPRNGPTPPLQVPQNASVDHLVVGSFGDSALPESPFADPTHTRTSAADPDDPTKMPQPPSPTHSKEGRINSIPPILPEIPQRITSVSSFQFNTAPAATKAGPSPLSQAHLADKPVPKRPETVYDDDDAYAGI